MFEAYGTVAWGRQLVTIDPAARPPGPNSGRRQWDCVSLTTLCLHTRSRAAPAASWAAAESRAPRRERARLARRPAAPEGSPQRQAPAQREVVRRAPPQA